MSFMLVEPGSWKKTPPLAEGQATIDRGGTLTARAEDLCDEKIEAYVLVFADADTLRVALRAPRDAAEHMKAVAVSVVTRGQDRIDSGRRRICIARAIRACGLECEAVRGRYDLSTKDGMLILNLTTVSAEPGGVQTRPPIADAKRGSRGADASRAVHGVDASRAADVPSTDPARNPARFAAKPRF